MTDPYSPSPDVTTSLVDKTLVMIIGPTAIGKSSLMNEIIAVDHRFKRVSGFTTRQPRVNDESGMYRYYSREQVDEIIQSHQAVQFMTHSTTGEIYGTEAIDYPAPYNLQDTISFAVEPYRQLPFQHTIAISLTTEPDQWKQWLDARFPHASNERTKRLIESQQSIEWSLAQTENHHWVVNHPNDISITAKEVIELVFQPDTTVSTPQQAKKLLKMALDLLSYEQN